MPRYSSKDVLREKLKYAIHFCKSIDTDDYARIALTADPMEDESSDESLSEGSEIATDSEGEIVSSDEWDMCVALLVNEEHSLFTSTRRAKDMAASDSSVTKIQRKGPLLNENVNLKRWKQKYGWQVHQKDCGKEKLCMLILCCLSQYIFVQFFRSQWLVQMFAFVGVCYGCDASLNKQWGIARCTYP